MPPNVVPGTPALPRFAGLAGFHGSPFIISRAALALPMALFRAWSYGSVTYEYSPTAPPAPRRSPRVVPLVPYVPFFDGLVVMLGCPNVTSPFFSLFASAPPPMCLFFSPTQP